MKKSNVTQIFVYAISLITITFVLFLASKFIFLFEKEVAPRADIKLFETIKKDYTSTKTSYLSEENYEYKVSQNLKYICFVSNISLCQAENLKGFKNIITNISTFDKSNIFAINFDNNIFLKKNIGEFSTNENCFCIEPKLKRFSLKFLNRKNKVIIEKIN